MAKIVYNACYGGFGLSEQAVRRYCELKGIGCYPEKDSSILMTYWTVPREQRTDYVNWRDRKHHSPESLAVSDKLYAEMTIHVSSIPRDDAALVQVVEELAAAANGPFSNLQIEDLASGTKYIIDEYDGNKSVMTPDDYDWIIAA
ncbi:hypothetical protein J0664_05805 [Rhizobium leguminosarum]|uniref:hypothetical protein n=1 Tax=Rhizobium leguminosarum TaxID=384 RepID=UPI001A9299B1|nr:hypothetical protein [Rhizobium leguminosarum]MBY5553776.1 hypothetical protein [Rhizobium leguminosarum]QSW24814.1 hypothetical protein J0664_05805 [Rhizobium leguminosarum]